MIASVIGPSANRLGRRTLVASAHPVSRAPQLSSHSQYIGKTGCVIVRRVSPYGGKGLRCPRTAFWRGTPADSAGGGPVSGETWTGSRGPKKLHITHRD